VVNRQDVNCDDDAEAGWGERSGQEMSTTAIHRQIAGTAAASRDDDGVEGMQNIEERSSRRTVRVWRFASVQSRTVLYLRTSK
jgi:hypothetical protein